MAGIRKAEVLIGGGQEKTGQTPPRILICDKLPDDALVPLRKRGYIVDVKTGLNAEALGEIIGDYDAAVVRSATKFTQEIFAKTDRLKIVVRAGVGIDNIDVKTATERGVVVVNTPEANTRSAAEHTIALMLATVRQIPQANQELTEGQWTRVNHNGIEVKGKTLAVLGFGNVGSEVALMAKAMGMEVVAYDPIPNEERAKSLGVSLVTLEQVLEQGDIISVHVPLLPQTQHLIDTDELSKMKSNAILINTSRGGIVNEEALVKALNEGVISGAALDVFEGEPEVSEAVRKHPKIVKTPHLGASTSEAQQRVTESAVEQLIRYFEGNPLDGAVNIPRISPEELHLLQPYVEVATRISSLAVAIARDSIEEVHICYSGNQLADRDKRPLKAAVVSGLATVTDDHVNIVNYEEVIKRRGFVITETTEPDSEYSNLIQMRLFHKEGETEISGIDGHDGPRVVSINGLNVDLPLKNQKHMLLVKNSDRPGMIAGVTGVLGKLRINVGDMRVARNESGGEAMMVVFLDNTISEEGIAAINEIDGVVSTNYVELT
jgi:D-3-phosphoglycerate dehydrogenase